LLVFWLGSFVLQTSLQGVERISSNTGDRDSNLGDNELGKDTNERDVLLPRVECLDSVLETELHTSVDDNTDGRWSDTIVE